VSAVVYQDDIPEVVERLLQHLVLFADTGVTLRDEAVA